MKNLILLFTTVIISATAFSQVVDYDQRQKFGLGVAVFNDFWMDPPDDMDTRLINQGANVFGMYNYQLGESIVYLSAGLGLGMHNLYSNNQIEDIKADTIRFINIDEDYKKSKVSLTYVDLPVEFRFKTKGGFRTAIGFKVGYLINSHTKYKGDQLLPSGTKEVKEKRKNIEQTETLRYGPTFRIGYKWINVFAYYQLSKLFQEDRGPQMYPVSAGIVILPW